MHPNPDVLPWLLVEKTTVQIGSAFEKANIKGIPV